jgi:hypothetical protein
MVPNSARSLAEQDRLSAKKGPLTWCFLHRQRALYWSGRQDSNLRPLDPQISSTALSCDNSGHGNISER